MAWTKKLWTLS